MLFSKRTENFDVEGLRARYDQIVAERQSLYSLVDKLTGYCEGLEKRIETQRVGIEALEDRVTNLEVALDQISDLTDDHAQALTDILSEKKKEEIDETS